MDVETYAALLRIARRRVGDQDAEDVVQDACERALRRYGHAGIENPRLLNTCVRTQAVDHLRKQAVRLAAPLTELDADDADVEARAIQEVVLEQALARAPLELRLYAAGYTLSEVAELLGEPVGTVKTVIHGARKRLAEEVGGEVDG